MNNALLLASIAVAAAGAPILASRWQLQPPKRPKIFTHADEEQIEKAQGKRDRKAAKRMARKDGAV